MFRFVVSLLSLLALLTFARADEVDKSAIQQTITNQLEAFKVDDGTKAYSYAAPIVTGVFPTVDIFMGMVKRGYQPIYRNTKYSFGTLGTDSLGRPAQHVTITAADGKRYEALYSMEKQLDGSWKIAGVQMVEVPAVDA